MPMVAYPRHHPHFPLPYVVPPAPVVVTPATYRTLMAPGVEGPIFIDYRGRTCRLFDQTIWMNGRVETLRGKACLTPDGSWRVVP
jgi:surface antigen